jgi:hypothetical protein
VGVSHRAVSFCRFWKPPRAEEVLPNFFVDRLVVFFAEKVLVYNRGSTQDTTTPG